jgi:hypothetical protein
MQISAHFTDPNPAIRALAFDNVLQFHQMFSTQHLEHALVPVLLKEFEVGWKDSNDWLLQNCGLAVTALCQRSLLQESHIPVINKFFDVFGAIYT